MDYNAKRGGTGMLMRIAFRNIFRNRRRTMFCVAAVGIAVFFIVFYSSIIAGMLKSMHEVVRVFELGDVRAVSKQYEAESEYNPVQYPVAEGQSLTALLAEIRALPVVKAAFPRISAYATLQENVIKHATLWALDMAGDTAVNSFNLTERTNGLVEGRYPAPGSNECAVGARFAEKAGLRIGDRIPLKTVSAQFSDKMWAPEITGIFRFDYAKADKETIIVDFSRLQRLLVLPDAAQQIVVYTHTPNESTEAAAALSALLGQSDSITRWQDQYWIVMMDMYKPIYYVIYLVFLIVATITMIIHERIKEIGMMGSLGMTRGEIVKVFFFESVFLAMAGAFAGVILGGLLTGIGQFFPIPWGAMMGGDTFAEMPAANAIFFDFSIAGLVQAWFLGVAVASVFTLIPSLKSAFVEPVEALRR